MQHFTVFAQFCDKKCLDFGWVYTHNVKKENPIKPSNAMKIWKESFVSRVRLCQGVFIALITGGLAVQSEATIYTMTSTASGVTYTAGFDTTSSALTSWQANGGPNQLSLQSLYYSVANGVVNPLTGASVVTHGAAAITANYTVAGVIGVADSITLNGNTLGEQIKFTNLSGSATTLSLFQYSDFILGGAAGGQTLNMIINNSSQSTANQSGGGASLQWQGQLTGGTVEVQANNTGAPFGPFNGSATALLNTPLSATGNAVFGYEFDAINLAAGNSLTVSETSLILVPEPATMGLIASGLCFLFPLWRRWRS